MRPLDSKGRDDYFRRVADVLIAQIKAGTAPWVQSWEPGERVQPYNLKTGKSYRGGNSTWLASVSQRCAGTRTSAGARTGRSKSLVDR